jgi:hypothetical protein
MDNPEHFFTWLVQVIPKPTHSGDANNKLRDRRRTPLF